MAILDRIGTIIRANLNDILDKSEDPEKMLDQILRDMKSAIEEARGQVAEMVAQQRMIETDVQRATAMVNEWDAKARAAVQQNRDDLARDSLRRKADYKKNLDLYQQQLDTQRGLVQKLKDDLAQLEFKYDDAVRRHDELINRSRRAAAQQRLSQQAQKFNTMDPTSELSRMEAKIRGQEAQVEADQAMESLSLDAQFQELERSGDIEDELAQLKSETSAPAPKKASGGEAYPS